MRWLVLFAFCTPLAAADFARDIRPLLETYCLGCHNAELQTGGINLEPYDSARAVLRDRKTWGRVLRVLRENEMPPAAPLPSAEQREALAAFVDQTIHDVDWDDVRFPGRVTLPRLNQAEYNNTIRDLTGLDLRPADAFPPDGEGETGFTNDRDGLFLPPLLLERYLKAAEDVVAEVIEARRNNQPFRESIEVETLLNTEANTPIKPWGYDLWKYQDTLYRYVRFPRFGRYVFEVRAWGQSELAGEVPGVTIRVGERIVGQTEVLATADEPRVYRFEADIPRGNHRVSLHWFKDYTVATNALNERLTAERDKLVAQAKTEGKPPPATGKSVLVSLDSLEIRAADAAMDRVFLAVPSAELPEREAARQTLAGFASRAWRRPVRPEEERYLLGLFDKGRERGLDFEESAGLGLKAILVSPNFLFRIERRPEPGEEIALDGWELASRLSYFLWLSMPDQELFDEAAGGLAQPETLRAQVRRMLAAPASSSFLETFAAQWLGYEGLGGRIKPDDVEFPDYTPALARDMKAEAAAFFTAIVREDRSLLELLSSRDVYWNETLARHYGAEGVVGREIRRVALPLDSPRGGLLGLGAVLTATSLPVRTSPVVRGKWALETLLGEELPPPPPDAGDLPPPSEETKLLTIREMYAAHRRNPSCAACHERIDPIGFGLENFDAVGRWRDTEKNGSPIDARGVLPGGESFQGPRELQQILLGRREKFARTITQEMLKFALGRELQWFDEPTVRELTAQLIAADYRPSALIEGIALSYPFRYQAAEASPEASE